MADKLRRGRYAEYGFRWSGAGFVPDPDQRALGSCLLELREAGLTWGRVMRIAREAGLVNRAGRPLQRPAAERMVFLERRARRLESLGLPYYPNCPDPPGLEVPYRIRQGRKRREEAGAHD